MSTLPNAFGGGGSGSGGGLLYPDSADRPFNSNTARNNWANNNKQELIKDTTVVNVGGTQWYLWTGESNPQTVSTSLWMDAAEIIEGPEGQQGDKGDKGDPGGRLPHKQLDLSFADMGSAKLANWITEGDFDYSITTDAANFANSPINEFSHNDGVLTVNGEQKIDTSQTPTHVIQTFTVQEGERNVTYKREGFESGAEIITNSHWECMTHTLASSPDIPGKPIPVDQWEIGSGLSAYFSGDKFRLDNLGFYQNPDFFDTDINIDQASRGTFVYVGSNLGEQHSITVNIPFGSMNDNFQVTVAASSDSLSPIEMILNGSRYDYLQAGDTYIISNFGGTAVPFKVGGSNTRSLRANDGFGNENNSVYDSVTEGSYTIRALDVTKIGGLTSGNYDAYLTVGGGFPEQFTTQTLILSNDVGDCYLMIRSRSNNAVSGVDFKDASSGGGGVDPADGFTLKSGAEIAATDGNGNAANVLGYTGGGDFSIGPRDGSHNTLIEVNDNAYVSYANGDVKRVLVDGDAGGGGGLSDNGRVDSLTDDFRTLGDGKWRIVGWDNSSNLPDWDSSDRDAVFINYGTFSNEENRTYTLSNRNAGIWSATMNAGTLSDWRRLDTDASQLLVDSSNPLEVQRTGGGAHDAISVTDAGKMTFGTPSSEIGEIEFTTSARRFSVDRRNDENTGQVFDQLAFTSDFVVPDPTWLEIDLNQTSGQRFPLRGVNAQSGQEEDATEHDRAYISYDSSGTEYTYPVELTYVREKGSAVFVNQTIEYTAGQFFVTISQEATKKLHFTVGSSAKVNTSYVNQGNESVRFHSLMTGNNSIDPGTYEFNVSGIKATAADVFTYNWDNNAHQETIQLSMVRDMFNGDYTVPSTSDRLRIVLQGDTYSLIVSSSIGGISGVGFTTGYSGVTPVENPQIERAEWHRAADVTVNPATLTDIILYQIEPFVTVPATGNRTTTLTFPSEAEFLATFYVPGVNEPQGSKPHIDTFQFKLWMDEVGSDQINHEVILKSAGDWLPFECNVNDNESGGIHHVIKKGNHATAVIHHFAFMKHEASADFGPFRGYSLQTQREDLWYPLSEVPSLLNGDYQNTRSIVIDDEEYLVADRVRPVIADVDLGKYQLVKLIDTAENSGLSFDTVTLGTVGQDASGFALSRTGADDTFADEEILQIASGVYDFNTGTAQAEDPIYVSNTGFVTLSTTQYRCGWVVAGDKIVLDIDLYNRSLAATTGGLQPDTDIEVTKLTLKNLANAGEESVIDINDDGDTEFNLSGTTTIRKVDKITRQATDVLLIDGDTGEMTYQGAIIDDKAPVTKEYLTAFGRGIGVPQAVDVSGGNTYQQTEAVALFSTVGNDINDVLIQIDADLIESETIISMPYNASVSSKNFDVEQIAGQGTSRNIRAGDTWKLRMIVDQAGANRWFWEKVKTTNSDVVYGLAGRNDVIDEVGVKAFAFAEGMPFHLLLETPTSSRLFHEFPKAKTHVFTPIDSNRKYEGVTINSSNENGPVTLGQYADIPLYTFEPNAAITRDQVGYINFPADVTIDSSQGFYAFGTVSGWAGGAQNNGTMAVYVGTNADNPKAGGSKIGFALVSDRLVILTGDGAVDATSATASKFNQENGVAHFYRFAFYVDLAGLMTYYIVDLNRGLLHTGQQQCNLNTVLNNPKLWIAYDREGANTSTVAVGETHLVMTQEGNFEQMWSWRF